jgi:glycine betaine/choline ABC-type transport system substrate-binding protein
VDTAPVAAALNALDQKLTTDAISQLNIDVTTDKQQPAAVAEKWLKTTGLL